MEDKSAEIGSESPRTENNLSFVVFVHQSKPAHGRLDGKIVFPIIWFMSKWSVRVLSLAVFLALLFVVALVYAPRKFLYDTNPLKAHGIPYQEFELESSNRLDGCGKWDPTIRLWWMPHSTTLNDGDITYLDYNSVNITYNSSLNDFTVIAVHGHGSNMGKIFPGELSLSSKVFYPLWASGYNILAFDQRNHGQSSYCPPVTLGYCESSEIITAVEWLLRNTSTHRFALWGESMGSSTVIQGAVHVQNNENLTSEFGERSSVCAVLSDSGFTTLLEGFGGWVTQKCGQLLMLDRRNEALSLVRIASSVLWEHLAYFTLSFDYRLASPVDSVNKLESPLMIVHGRSDSIIRVENAFWLMEKAEKVKELWFHIHDFEHVRPYEEQGYFNLMMDFFNSTFYEC